MRLLSIAVLFAFALRAAAGDSLEESVARMAKVRACWSPSFSPDGSRIAFVSDLTGVPQAWTVPAEGGWPALVTDLDDPVGSVAWSPDGRWLALSVAPGGGMNQQIYLARPDGTGLSRATDGGKENNWMGDWSHDGRLLSLSSNRAGGGSMDAWTYDVAARELSLLAKNPGIGRVADLSRDGRRAALYRMENRGDDNLFLRDLSSGTESLLTPHEGPGSFSGGHFSPDGATVYLSSNADRDLEAFARVKIGDGGRPGKIEVIAARDDGELQAFSLTNDGRVAVLVWNVSGRNEIAVQDLETLAITPGPELPCEIVGGLDVSRDGRRVALVLSGSALPADVWVLDRETKSLRRVTESPRAGVDLDSLVRPELRRYRAHDGLDLSGWLYRPRGASGPVPMVVSFHGGPEGQERPAFNPYYQAILSRGIGVFAPNVRGSSGFGKAFVNLDNGERRFDGLKDIESTAEFLAKERIAEGGRIGIMGGSYGGYMTMAGLAFYPDLFAAGANLFGIVNFETFFAHTEPWMAAISTVEYGDPRTEADLLRRLSPIGRLDRIVAPTLVLHGANDTNVPVVEAEQVVERLKKRGVPVEYVLFPDEGHGFRKTANKITSAVAIARFFEKHLAAGR